VESGGFPPCEETEKHEEASSRFSKFCKRSNNYPNLKKLRQFDMIWYIY